MNEPGYTATRATCNPLFVAVVLTCSEKPGAAIVTAGMPIASAAMLDPVSFGVQRPQPPLPEMTASMSSSFNLDLRSSTERLVMPGPGNTPADPISFNI